jgi:hypothetical protein
VQRAREQVRGQLLRCCSVELDARGGVMDYAVKDQSACGPSACGCVPPEHPASSGMTAESTADPQEP